MDNKKRSLLLLGIFVFIFSRYILNQNKIVEACVNTTCVKSWSNATQSYHDFCWCNDTIGGGGGGGGGGNPVPTSTPRPTATPTPFVQTPPQFSADFNSDGKVDLIDYEIWRNSVYK